MTCLNKWKLIIRARVDVNVTTLSLLLFVLALLPVTGVAGSRGERQNDLAIELLGRCGWYSASYQRLIDQNVGIEASTSVVSESGLALAYLGGGVRAYLSSSDVSGFIVGGVVGVTQSGGYVASRLFSKSNSTTYGYVGPGVEYRASTGFLMRGTLYFLILGGEVHSWPGVQFGMAF